MHNRYEGFVGVRNKSFFIQKTTIVKKRTEGRKIMSNDNKKNEKSQGESILSGVTRFGDAIADLASDVKDKAVDVKDDVKDKINELDNMLMETINEYNEAYTLMNDNGLNLYIERIRAVDTIQLSENLINSIANHPKEFDVEFETIIKDKDEFSDACEFAEKELEAARGAAGGVGAGVAAGAAVTSLAPSAAMWIATTFGTASTGTAISSLSGAAATNAALAWLGGGALAAEGGGMAAGNALLAMAGPIGWGIAGATLLTSIVLFARKRSLINSQKNDEIEAIKRNTEEVNEIKLKLEKIIDMTNKAKEGLDAMSLECMSMYGGDYTSFDENQKEKLGALVNNTKALSALFKMKID